MHLIIQTQTHSHNHSTIYSLTHKSTHAFSVLLNRMLSYPFIQALKHPLTNSSSYLTTDTPNHSCKQSLLLWTIRLITRSVTNRRIHLITQSLTNSLSRLLTHKIIQSFAHSDTQSLTNSLKQPLD